MYIQFPGRYFCLAAVFSLTLCACHQADHPAGTPASRRMALIAALKELRGRILSDDKTQIGRIFSFPVPDSVFNPYFNDSLLQVQMGKNGGMLTQELFNAHFKNISGAAELEGFKGFFTFINPDSLEHKDSIDVDTVLANEGSSRIYWIHIQGDSLVDISYGTGHCQPVSKDTTGVVRDSTSAGKDTIGGVKGTVGQVTDSVGKGDDEEEDDPSACEHSCYWEFSFDGKTLHLLRQGAAD